MHKQGWVQAQIETCNQNRSDEKKVIAPETKEQLFAVMNSTSESKQSRQLNCPLD